MMLKLLRCKKKCERGSGVYLRAFFRDRLAILTMAFQVAAKIVPCVVTRLDRKLCYALRLVPSRTQFYPRNKPYNYLLKGL